MRSSEDFVAEARAMVGVKWRLHGRSEKGIDCAGLPIVSLAGVGIGVRDCLNYDARMPDSKLLLDIVNQVCEPTTLDDIGPGRLALTSWGKTRDPRHVCICDEDNRIIHCDASSRRVVSVHKSWMDEIGRAHV